MGKYIAVIKALATMQKHSGIDMNRDRPTAVGRRNQLDCRRQTAGVVGMAMGKHDSFDRPHVDAQTRQIVFKRDTVRSGVEQDSTLTVANLASHHQGHTEARETQAFAGKSLRPSLHHIVHFVGNSVRNRRQPVADIIDQNKHVGAAQNLEVGYCVTSLPFANFQLQQNHTPDSPQPYAGITYPRRTMPVSGAS